MGFQLCGNSSWKTHTMVFHHDPVHNAKSRYKWFTETYVDLWKNWTGQDKVHFNPNKHQSPFHTCGFKIKEHCCKCTRKAIHSLYWDQ